MTERYPITEKARDHFYYGAPLNSKSLVEVIELLEKRINQLEALMNRKFFVTQLEQIRKIESES